MVATTEEARHERPSMSWVQGFKNFLMQGDVVIVAIGLVIALAFSTLIASFTDNIINPLVQAAGSGGTTGLGFHVHGKLVNIGAFISAVIYFVIFMAVIYFVLVVPYRALQKKRGVTVFGDPPPAQTCPACLSEGLPMGATKCRYCGTTLAGGTV
ncbi:MAG TPA: MscL family protein [Gaiellaceae bacterium]|nr:MscL family protein [Gaiellaceae bacterium]